MFESEFEKYLKPKGVKLGRKTSQAYKVLEVLYKDLGEWVSKKDIAKAINYKGNDLQEPRHLSTRGFFVESNRKSGDNLAYRLVSMKKTLPNWNPARRVETLGGNAGWNEMKEMYDHRCASCGAKEGKRHHHGNSAGRVKLEKGHMDPNKPMTNDNIIPQCSACNKGYRDRYIFDINGKVRGINFESAEIQKMLAENGYIKI